MCPDRRFDGVASYAKHVNLFPCAPVVPRSKSKPRRPQVGAIPIAAVATVPDAAALTLPRVWPGSTWQKRKRSRAALGEAGGVQFDAVTGTGSPQAASTMARIFSGLEPLSNSVVDPMK